MDKETPSIENKNSHIASLIAMFILLVAVGAGSYYAGRKGLFMPRSMAKQGQNRDAAARPSGSGMPGMTMTPATPPAVSDQQTAQLALGSAKTTTTKTFNITGGNFYFVPNKITVNQGDQVTFVMTNVGGTHDLIIDDLSVKTPVIKTGEVGTATFTADKTGTFKYYCDIPGHKAKGMVGTLIVQ